MLLIHTRTQPEESVQKDLNWINDGFQIHLPAGLKRAIAAALGMHIHLYIHMYMYVCIHMFKCIQIYIRVYIHM